MKLLKKIIFLFVLFFIYIFTLSRGFYPETIAVKGEEIKISDIQVIPIGEIAIEYLKKRNIDKETIKKFGIGLSIQKVSLTDYLKNKKYDIDKLINIGITNDQGNDIFINRIMFPIYDLSGNKMVYQIFEKYEVLYNDTNCISQNTANKKIVTLITCNNLDNLKRLIIKAK